jgi:hypothetical protein
MQEETNIEIVVEEESENVQDGQALEKKKKKDLFFELTLFFILGLLIGITVKTEAVKRITIGFNDYQLPAKASRYDIPELKRNLLQQAAKEQAANADQQPVTGNQ